MIFPLPSVRVSRKGEERLRSGHLWVFGDDLRDVQEGMPAGQWVRVFSRAGEFLGTATANLDARLALRRISREEAEPSAAFIEARIKDALSRRAAAGLGTESVFRAIYSEGDFLPGLIVDRFGGILSAQILTAGMENIRETIFDALERVMAPRLVYERSEGSSRRLEGLDDNRGAVRGGGPPEEDVDIDGVRFLVNVETGPKTGFFIDQRENRRIVRDLAEGKDVLDGFCADGGFGLYALSGGARSVFAIDSSRRAIEAAQANAERNGFLSKWEGDTAEMFQALRELAASGRRFGLVVLDPPSFTKTRVGREGALRGYQDINRIGLALLSPGGLLATSSCTQLIDMTKWKEALAGAAADAGVDLELIAMGRQPADHPVLLAVPETEYLKFAVYRKRIS